MKKKEIKKVEIKELDKRKMSISFPIKFAEKGRIPKEIHVIPTGEWDHPVYGLIVITPQDIAQFKENFDRGIRKGVSIIAGHEVMDEKPAIGWFKELINKGEEGLFAIVEWNEQGRTLLKTKSYKFFSPEFFRVYEDPETQEITENVLTGGALTNKPYFKELEAIVLSEPKITNQFNFNTMNLKDILAKAVADLSAEEKTFLVENKEKLDSAELETFGSVLEEKTTETKEETKEETETETETKEEEKKTETETEEKKVEASDKNMVSINASELSVLRDTADKGAKAFDELRENKIKAEAKKLIFSEQNSQGRVLGKDEDKLFKFMLALSDTQRKEFAEIVTAIPKKNLFTEIGSEKGDSNGTTKSEFKNKIAELQKVDSKMTYSDALRKVSEENPELLKKHELEIAGK